MFSSTLLSNICSIISDGADRKQGFGPASDMMNLVACPRAQTACFISAPQPGRICRADGGTGADAARGCSLVHGCHELPSAPASGWSRMPGVGRSEPGKTQGRSSAADLKKAAEKAGNRRRDDQRRPRAAAASSISTSRGSASSP